MKAGMGLGILLGFYRDDLDFRDFDHLKLKSTKSAIEFQNRFQ